MQTDPPPPEMSRSGTALVPVTGRTLTPEQYADLADVPPEIEWLANITNPRTRRAYKIDVGEFMRFTGLRSPVELRTVTRAHVIAWRKELELRQLKPASIRRKLAALPEAPTIKTLHGLGYRLE